MRSDYRTVVTWTRRGDGERAAYNLARLRASWDGGDGLQFSRATLRDGFIAAGPAAWPSSPSTGSSAAAAPSGRSVRGAGAARCARSPTCAPATSSSTRTTASPASPASTRRRSRGVTRDYLELEYAGTDRVFMPVDQLAKITRYVGAGGSPPAAEQARRQGVGGDEGARPARGPGARGRAAQPLRRAPPPAGHAFPEDGEWLREFEARFPYQETADQREAIEHVKADMERAQPMDRLICGDVGYGKTEVALRAAFKAADDGKQVLVLAPTTILAQQHFGTFSERLKDYPFTIEHVSRFRSAKEQREAASPASTTAASTSSSAPTACSAATCAARTSG